MAPDSVLIGETEARALSCSPIAQPLWVGFLGYEPLSTEWEPQGEKGWDGGGQRVKPHLPTSFFWLSDLSPEPPTFLGMKGSSLTL